MLPQEGVTIVNHHGVSDALIKSHLHSQSTCWVRFDPGDHDHTGCRRVTPPEAENADVGVSPKKRMAQGYVLPCLTIIFWTVIKRDRVMMTLFTISRDLFHVVYKVLGTVS